MINKFNETIMFNLANKYIVLIALSAILSGCGGGGGSDSGNITNPQPVELATTYVDLSGPASHPDGGIITVTVDDSSATVKDGTWSYSLPLDSDLKSPTVRMYRDGELILIRQFQITRTP